MTEMMAVETGTAKEGSLGAHEQLKMALERMSDLLDRLDTVLTPVLQLPSPMAIPSSEPAETSPLRDNIYHLDNLNSRLASLIERVDV